MTVDNALELPRHVGQDLFADAPTLSAALADRVAGMLRHAIGRRGRASLVVSGGRSPLPFLRALGQRKLDWSRVTVTLADERWLPPDHPDSNAGLVIANLLQGPAAEAHFVPLYGGENSPGDGLAACTARLDEIQRPFDVVVLGMGDDGHFASIFPGIPRLGELLSESGPALAATVPPAAPHARMTLALSAILDARRILLPISGAAKREVIEEAACGNEGLPIATLLRQRRAPLHVFFCPST
ncbi:6-phosphogluconolactonase [Aromatoleum toluclasticum]|uniref:6-phosphogluconolactonase n=1 Tax=Aromatoleum toluclasticum TaxID=92003 RepID=UPI000362DB12|nr:6-phosphogluconolactonase [Aromatoleum toluclasticum]